MSSYPSNVQPGQMDLTPCIVKFKKQGETAYTELGGTLGNVKLKLQYTKSDIKADQFGTPALDKRVSGYMAQIETEITQIRNLGLVQILFPHATRNTTWTTQAVTISNASPGVFTVASTAALSVGQEINFTTTGVLPAPLVVGQIYYISDIPNGTTFEVSETFGGASLNTTTAGSGTHTAQYSPTADSLLFETKVGDSDLAHAGELLLHPQSADPSDDRFDFVFFLATATAESELVYSPTEQMKMKIVWSAYLDTSVVPARFARYGNV